MRTTWKKLLAMLLVIMMMLSCVVTTSAEDVTGGTSTDTTTETTQPEDTTEGDTTTEGGDTSTEGGDTTTEGGDTTTEGGDTTTEGGDTTTEGGDTSTEGGDTTTEGGDTTTEGGDTTTEGGDTTTEGGDTTTEGGESTEGGDTEDGENEDPQPDTTDKPALTEEMFSIGGSVNYTGSAQTVSVSTNLTPADYSVVGEVTYDGSTTAPTNAGTYSVSVVVTAKEDGAYQGSVTVTGTLTINRVSGEVSVTLSNPSVTYNGQEQVSEVTAVTAAGITLTKADYEVTEAKGTIVGTYTAKVKVTNPNFDVAEGTATMEITKATGNVTVELANSSVPYNGQEQVSEVTTVTAAGITLTKDDYEVTEEAKGTNAGTYTAKVKVTNPNFDVAEGTATMVITKATGALTISPATTVVDYTGADQKPELTVMVDGKEAIDATITWSVEGELTKVGTYTATVTLSDNYDATGDNTATLTIKGAGEFNLSLGSEAATYTGSNLMPSVMVGYDGGDPAGCYTVVWTDASGAEVTEIVNVGTYTVTVTGNEGTLYEACKAEATFTVAKATDGMKVIVSDPVIYNGAEQEPELTITFNGAGLVEGEDYTVEWSSSKGEADFTTAATYTAKIVYQGNFSGETSATYTINPYDLTGKTDVVFTYDTDEFIYNGKAQQPEVESVTTGGLTLAVDTDFTVADNQSVNASEEQYTLTITGQGNYTGTATLEYTIVPYDLTGKTDVVFTYDTDEFIYNGKAQQPEVESVTTGGLTLAVDTDFTVADNQSVNASEEQYTLTITGQGNYTGTATMKYTINPYDLTDKTDVVFKYDKDTFIYNGVAQQPKVESVTTGGLTLAVDTDFTVVDNQSVNASEEQYTLTITGQGNYTGTATMKYTINPYVLTEANGKLVLPEGGFIYNGDLQQPKVELSYEGAGDVAAECPVPESVEAKEYTVTVTGAAPNFTGSFDLTYSIEKFDIAKGTVELVAPENGYYYTALLLQPTVNLAYPGKGEVTAEYTVPESVAVGSYEFTVTGTGNFTGTVNLSYSIDWLPTPANPYTLDGDIHGEWYYGEGGVTIVPAEGYKVAADHSDAAAFADTLTITDCYWDNNTTQIYLQDANGGITNVIPVETFMLDSVKPNVADISMSSSTAFIHVTANDAFSGAVISLYVYNTESDPIEQETADHTVEKVLVAGFAGEEISFSYTVTDEGTYIVEVSDVAGNLAESKTVYYGDKDSDGLNDAFEAYWGSDPENADSDGDGLLDSHEYILQTDPLNPDTDGDTLNDFDEARTYETDPLAVDGDQDGIDDPTSVMLRVFFEGQNLPTAVAAQTGTLVNGAAPALTPAEQQEKLSALLAGGTEVSLYTRRGRDVRNADGDVIKLSNDDYGNIVVIKIDQANERVFAIDTEKMVLLAFRGEKNVVIESAIDLKEILGEDVQNIAYASDDSGSLLMLAAWDGDKAASDLVVVVTDQLFGEDAVAYVIDGSAGSTRFAVSPDGSKIAFLQDEITVADLAAGEATFATGATISFTADGRLITDMSGNAQDGYTAAVCKVDTSALELTSEPVAFSGTYYLQQPNLGGAELLVVLPAGQSEQYPDGYSITLPMTVLVTLSENMDVLGYLPLEGEDVSFHSASMAE